MFAPLLNYIRDHARAFFIVTVLQQACSPLEKTVASLSQRSFFSHTARPFGVAKLCPCRFFVAFVLGKIHYRADSKKNIAEIRNKLNANLQMPR